MWPFNRNRKSYYVNRRVQGGVLSRFCMYWIVYHFVLWHAMILFQFVSRREQLFEQFTQGGVATATPMQSFADLYGTFAAEHYSLLVCAALVLPFLLWDVLKMTHRIAGPLVRFQHALRDLAAGRRIRRIELRDGDLLTGFQDVFNEYLEKIDRIQKPAESVSGASTVDTSEVDSQQYTRADEELTTTGFRKATRTFNTDVDAAMNDLEEVEQAVYTG